MSTSASPDAAVIAVELHYFAAAADAAGRTEERLEMPDGATLAGLPCRLRRGPPAPVR